MTHGHLTERETKVLAELRANVEGMETVDSSGAWLQVYLDNCPSSRQTGWSGVLGSLKKKGLYRPQGDDCFGDVLMPEIKEQLTELSHSEGYEELLSLCTHQDAPKWIREKAERIASRVVYRGHSI